MHTLHGGRWREGGSVGRRGRGLHGDVQQPRGATSTVSFWGWEFCAYGGRAVSYGGKLESATVGDKHGLVPFFDGMLNWIHLTSCWKTWFMCHSPPDPTGSWRVCLCPAGRHQRHRRSTPFSAGGHLQWCDRTLVEEASVWLQVDFGIAER